MTRTVRGTRVGDAPHTLHSRRVGHTTLLGWFSVVLGWVGFLGVLGRCVLQTVHP